LPSISAWPTYRSRIYPPYKANREPHPLDLLEQFEHCRQVCRHLGLAVFTNPEYEADDIIGTLGCLMRDEGVRSAFITRDKDLAQLVRDGDLFWDYGAREQLVTVISSVTTEWLRSALQTTWR